MEEADDVQCGAGSVGGKLSSILQGGKAEANGDRRIGVLRED